MNQAADNLIELGREARNAGNLTAAAAYYQEAAQIYRGSPYPLRFAHTIRHVGDILRNAGEVDRARPCYEEALAVYRAHPETPDLDLGNAIRGFALLLEDAGEPEHALELWRECKELYMAVGVQAGVKECDARLARLARKGP